MSSSVVVDDQPDGGALVYNGPWVHILDITSAVNDTLSFTNQVGANIVFKFNGTGVGVVGALAPVNGSDPPISTYTVDDGSPVVFTASSNVTQTQYGQTFFLQQSLFASEHTLVINVTRASAQTPFLFDYIGFIPISSPTNSLAPSGIPSPSPSTVAGYDNKGSPPPFGPIVGGVVGGLALLVFVGLGLFFLFGRRRDGQPYFSGTAEVGGMGGQETKSAPSPMPPSIRSTQRVAAPSTYGPSYTPSPYVSRAVSPPMIQQVFPASVGNISHGRPPSDMPVSYPAGHSTHSTASPPTVRSSGRDADVLSDVPDDVPPEYTEH